MAALPATTPSVRAPPVDLPKLPSTAAFPSIGGFASRQGWQERVGRIIAFFSDHVPLLPPALRIAWVCSYIRRNLLELGIYKKVLGGRDQPIVPAAAVELLATNNLWKHRFKMLHPLEKTKEPDKLPNSPTYRVGTCNVEGLLAAESHITFPSIPHLPSSIHPPPSPLVPPTLPLGDLMDGCTMLSASHPPSETPPIPGSKLSQVESTPVNTDSISLKHPIVVEVHSTTCFARTSAVIRKRTSLESKPIHGPSPQTSTNHPSPPSPFLGWTPFIPTRASKGGYVKKRSGKIDFCGGFSDVYRAEIRFRTSKLEPELKQGVALKILRRVGLDGKDEDQVLTCMIKRLNQETITWIGLVHPNIVPLVGFTITPVPSLISPWYERGNIRNYLKHHPSANRFKLIYDVAKGLEYLHSQIPRIAHGDIKPENVLINEQGDALLSDFGLTTVLDDECWYTASHHGGGSFRYMAPELFLAVQDHRTCSADVYSFASLAFEVLTGHLPHKRLKTDGQICVSMINTKGPEYPVDEWNQYPELKPIEDVLRSCWSRVPEQRPSMKKIVRELSVLVRSTDA